jgi:hypothetical protein
MSLHPVSETVWLVLYGPRRLFLTGWVCVGVAQSAQVSRASA